MARRPSGLILIELLVVVVVVTVVGAMGAAVVPRAQERQRQVESLNNVRNMAQILSERSIRKRWPPFDGKNFVLSLVAYRMIDPRNSDYLKVFFSPGDHMYGLWDDDATARFKEITVQTLQAGTDFHELTSYAGRRNYDPEYRITADLLRRGVPIICDDDDGPLHHLDGLVMAFTDGRARFVEWKDLGMTRPEDPDDPEPFLGDNASTEMLLGLSSD